MSSVVRLKETDLDKHPALASKVRQAMSAEKLAQEAHTRRNPSQELPAPMPVTEAVTGSVFDLTLDLADLSFFAVLVTVYRVLKRLRPRNLMVRLEISVQAKRR